MLSKTQLMKIVEEFFIGVAGVHRTEWEMDSAARQLGDIARDCQQRADKMRQDRKRQNP